MAELEVLFTHEPLDLASSKTIRLIEVLPPGENESVRCKLIHSTTDHAYVALSYVCGTDEPVHVIYINHRPYKVRRNLWDFLNIASQELRYEPSTLGSQGDDLRNAGWTRQYIWIDALCIDQKDTLERNHQVQQMGNIYSSAQRVLVWFGTKSLAVTLIEKLHTFDVGKDFRSLPDSKVLVRRFCEDVYWTRAWTTQEALLAKDIMFLANEVEAEWVELKAALVDSLIICSNGDTHPRFQPFNDVLRRQIRYTLLENIWRFRRKQSLDRRDVIYSLLSISRLYLELEVDYNVTAPGLALRVLKASGLDQCLCFARIIDEALKFSQELGIAGERPFAEVHLHNPFTELRVNIGGGLSPPLHYFCSDCAETIVLSTIYEASLYSDFRVYCLSCSHKGPITLSVGWTLPAHLNGHLVLARCSFETPALPWYTFWRPPKQFHNGKFRLGSFRIMAGTRVLNINDDGSARLQVSSEDFATWASLRIDAIFESGSLKDKAIPDSVIRKRYSNPRWTLLPRD